MVAVAIAALDFGAIRAIHDSQTEPRAVPRAFLFYWGALPMANVMGIGMLIGQRRPGSRPFLVWFEAFGVIALALFIASAIWCPSEIMSSYVLPFLDKVQMIIGWSRPFGSVPIAFFGVLVMLCGPQLAFAVVGGSLSCKLKITITRR
jgi:hypothetical protein